MFGVIERLEGGQIRGVPDFQAGDRVKVHFQVVEGTRRRTQVFEGTVIKRQGTGVRETFTVRKQSFGGGVERTFPLHSPKIERIEVVSRGDVRRAKLYYLRGRVGRRARVRERQFTGPIAAGVEPGLVGDEPVPEDEAGPQTEGDVVRAPEGEAAREEAARDSGTEPAAGGEPEDQAASRADATGEAEAGGEAEAAGASDTEPATDAESGSSEG